jgi:hypothetical protein
MNLTKWFLTVAVITPAIFCGVSGSLAQQNQTMQVLRFAPQSEIRFAAPWTPSAIKYTNAQELVVMRLGKPIADERGVKQSTEYPVARVLITTELRRSHADALKRLESIAASRKSPAEFIEVGGWPAVEVQFVELLPRRGVKGEEDTEVSSPDVSVQRAITAIADADKVVMFDVSVLPDTPQGLMEDAITIAHSARFAKPGKQNEVKKALEMLRATEKKRQVLFKQSQSLAPEAGVTSEAIDAPSKVGTPVPVVATTGRGVLGELEIAASANANNIVIASNNIDVANGGLSFSTNRGANFRRGAAGIFPFLNDPSLARAASGDFYLAVIAFPTGTTDQLNVSGCTNAVSRSTDNGANFRLQGYSAQCPDTGAGVCFPDQEHITGDAGNAAAGGDQLYAVWRNFAASAAAPDCKHIGSSFTTSSITCSQNNGTSWTARAAIPGAGDFPRVAVGKDGAVYVVTISGNSVLLNRFSSCASGLTAAVGFPVTVATLSGTVTCPVPGLDRCNDGNTLSSPTVATDPALSNHLFVSFAENNGVNTEGMNTERIVALESGNRGLTFSTRQSVSNAPLARRFLPWSCSTRNSSPLSLVRGKLWVGWYDRRAASAAHNDLTDYFIGTPSGIALNQSNKNLSNNPDPQCASGWPMSVRNPSVNPPGDSESCSVQPQLAGKCNGFGNPCDFSDGCPPGEGICLGGSGGPKYGDYNGIACSDNFVIAAWASATPPRGVTAPAPGINIYAEVLPVVPLAQLTVFKILEHPDPRHLRLFNLKIDGVTVRANVNSGSTGPQVVSPGNHTVSEAGGTGTSLGDFHTVIGGDCAADGTVSLALGESKTCTITNYDNVGGCTGRSQCCNPGDGTQGCLECRQTCP